VLGLVVELATDRPSEFFRNLRLWSRSSRLFYAQEPIFAVPSEGLERTVASCRTVIRSDRSRRVRLLSCAAWLLVLGVVAPCMSVVWVLDGSKGESVNSFQHQLYLLAAAFASLGIAVCLPTSEQAEGLQSAVEQLGSISLQSRNGLPQEDLDVSQSSIAASQPFVTSLKAGMVCCSSLAALVTLQPLLGMCVASVVFLATSLSHATFVGCDVKLSVLNLRQPASISIEHLDISLLGRSEGVLPAPSGNGNASMCAMRALMSISAFVIAFRSLVVWASTLRGCSEPERDVHDVACFPSLVAMICPGFLAFGSLLRFTIFSCEGLDEFTSDPSRCCIALTTASTCLPLALLNMTGAYVALKVLASLSNSPLFEVFSLWRIPTWEEGVVLVAVAALWVALLVLFAVVSACFKLLGDSGGPIFFGIFATAYLLVEMFLTLLVFGQSAQFLPKILMIISSVSTAFFSVLGLCCIFYYVIAGFAGAPREKLWVGYVYLWG
ncbi:unnamed protein product, partial [Polarella glacialis]